MAGRGLRKATPRKTLLSLVTKAVREWKLIEEGDRVLLAVSGGKDSTALAYALSQAHGAFGVSFTLGALHVSTDVSNDCVKSVLSERLASWGVPFTDIFVPVIDRLKSGKKMNCYWCSTQRRTELLKYAMENGYNKIALGHHMDDIIETFFMNMLNKGELEAMPVRLVYQKYPIELIRPLALLEERQIIEFANAEDILKSTCTCSFGVNSERRDVRKRIATLTGGASDEKRRIMQALSGGAKELLISR